MSDARIGANGKPRNRNGERMSVTVLDSEVSIGDHDTPSATFSTPSGDVSLDADVVFLPEIPDGPKGGGAPARWQVLSPRMEETGEYTLTLAGHEFHATVDDSVNPRVQRKEARTRAQAAEEN